MSGISRRLLDFLEQRFSGNPDLSTTQRVKSLALPAALAVLAVLVRIALLDFKSLDFYASLKPWYNVISSEGFRAFATGFSTYNPPYLYLLYLIARFMPDLPVTVAVKLPSLLADFICAWLVFLIVARLSPSKTAPPLAAAAVVLFAPSVVLNSAFWGQADSLFTAGILACVYWLLCGRSNLAMLAFGLALAFKLQAIFFAPVLIALALRGELPWRAMLLTPLIMLLALIPSWLAGRPFLELLQIYTYQASQFEFITMNAPSVYAWVPGSKQVFNLLYVPGILLGAAAAFMWLVLVHKSTRPVRGLLLVEVALVSLLLVPLFLPKMHDRYFFPADVLSVALGFLNPALFLVPVLVLGASFLSYHPFLFGAELVPMQALAAVMLVACAITAYQALLHAYAPAPAEEIEASTSAPQTPAPGGKT